MRRSARMIVSLVIAGFTAGCGDDTSSGSGGSTGSGGDGGADAEAEAGADAGEGADETAGGDGVACERTCAQSLADCCFGEQPAPGFPSGAGCPSVVFPNNWVCDQGECALASGCDPEDADSEMEDCAKPTTGLSCRYVGGVGMCVAICENNSDCTDLHNMAGTSCSQYTDGPNSESYCRQALFY